MASRRARYSRRIFVNGVRDCRSVSMGDRELKQGLVLAGRIRFRLRISSAIRGSTAMKPTRADGNNIFERVETYVPSRPGPDWQARKAD